MLVLLRIVVWTTLVANLFNQVQAKPSAGTPVYTGVKSFPTEVFSGMYYEPKNMEQEPRPKVARLNGGYFPDSLNNPTQLPTAPPRSEALMPPQLHGKAQVDQLIKDAFNIAGQLFKKDQQPSATCGLCRTGLATLQKLAHVSPEIVPDILASICDTFGVFDLLNFKQECKRTLSKAVYGGPITQVLSAANFSANAMDAQGICGQVPSLNLCPKPTEKFSDDFLNKWFKGKRHAPQSAVQRWEQRLEKRMKMQRPKSELLRVPHLTDLHIDGRYMVGTESDCTFGETVACCRVNSYNNTKFHGNFMHGPLPDSDIVHKANYWGSLECDAPWALMANSFQALKELGGSKGWDFAIFTGDLVSHDDLYRYSHDLAEYSEQSLYDMFKHYLGDAPLIPSLGNHDTSPENLMAPKSLPQSMGSEFQWDIEYVAQLWSSKNWLNDKQANQVRAHQGGYSISPRKGFRIIALNTDFWYYVNFYNYINMENPDMSGNLRFLTDELLAAEQAGERVWIIGHVLTGWSGSEALNRPGNLFYQIVSRFAPHTLAHIFFGHTHEDHFQLFYFNDNGASLSADRHTKNAVAQAFIAPSITPYTNLNPAIRVLSVDPDTYEVMDFDQYYSQITEFDDLISSRANHGPVWRHLYSAREAYSDFHASVRAGTYRAGVHLNGTKWPKNASLNGTFWAALTDEMEVRPELLTYFSQVQSRLSPKTKPCTTSACYKANLCYMRAGSPLQGQQCDPDYDTVARS
ncbi:hypothetical protein MYAM1_003620 [Malassezia yamatoensis]|uniref:Calcineurin-like phosphoesterase domain-containing protein n=1 Tax=Malassezia yamatoensis TaxID=253288 RepID=A0AAJ5YUZ3_9BASI|nr:hypothetical protein MYAM1_003620 [Malassezia yamatoensis]